MVIRERKTVLKKPIYTKREKIYCKCLFIYFERQHKQERGREGEENPEQAPR